MISNRSRRHLVATVLIAALAALAGCSGQDENVGTTGRVDAPPLARNGAGCEPGEHTLRLGNGRPAHMRVTPGGSGGRRALLLVLHGAGGTSKDGLWAFRGAWDLPGVVLVAPSAQGGTWSLLLGTDTDLPFVNRALGRALSRCRIDERKIGVGGFSDGATYALSLGLSNGALFRAVMALSPGGMAVKRAVGRPRVFIAHGKGDDVLPLTTSDVLVRELRGNGYSVTYRRFRGGHEVPLSVSRAAARWFLRP
jgi:predicted esterase